MKKPLAKIKGTSPRKLSPTKYTTLAKTVSVMTKQTFVVADDHEAILEGTCKVLKGQYPEANILTASTADGLEALIKEAKPNLPDVVVMDLSIPNKLREQPKTENGLQLLQRFLTTYPTLNLVIQSAHVRSLIRLKPSIESHYAGFTIADKSLPTHEMLKKVDYALEGAHYTPPEMRNGLELKPAWLEMLQFAFNTALTDKEIAKVMNVSERTVRQYWTNTQDALQVYSEKGYNIRIQTYKKARSYGLVGLCCTNILEPLIHKDSQ
jgi:DNA-binding NarL/FixJ family response regulator